MSKPISFEFCCACNSPGLRRGHPTKPMPYAVQTIYLIRKGPRNLGNSLGRLAIDLDFSVLRIAKLTGATRQTVYNWLSGGEVLAPYRPAIERLIEILKSAKTADKAWEKACQEFNLQP